MTRIIAGKFKGQRIEVPKSGVRPTTDRVREAIFSALDSRISSWQEQVVLDVFAGSGGLGIEALSRGATKAVFLEKDRITSEILKKNLTKLGANAEVILGPADKYQPSQNFTLVFLDPPFAIDDSYLFDLLTGLRTSVMTGALVLVERGKGNNFRWPIGYREIFQRG
jgi:16S rRNA (guanine966-N2)-methyltransferase